MFKTLTDYNDLNNTSLSKAEIQESMNKFIEDESIAYYNNVTTNTFRHASNTQRENENAILTSEKLDKSDALAEAIKYLTMNDAEYYESDSANMNDAKVDVARNSKVATHTSYGNKIIATFGSSTIKIATPRAAKVITDMTSSIEKQR